MRACTAPAITTGTSGSASSWTRTDSRCPERSVLAAMAAAGAAAADVHFLLQRAGGPADGLQRIQHLVGAGNGQHLEPAALRVKRDAGFRIKRAQRSGKPGGIWVGGGRKFELHGITPESWAVLAGP